MAETVVVLRVVRRGERADRLLDQVGRALVDGPLNADDHGAVAVRVPRRGPQAWDAVRDALDDSGADWRQWLHLPPRPTR